MKFLKAEDVADAILGVKIHSNWMVELEDVARAIADIPAADVRERVTSAWMFAYTLDGKPLCYCGRCGCGVKNNDTDTYIDMGDARFCPNCGAEMVEKCYLEGEKSAEM